MCAFTTRTPGPGGLLHLSVVQLVSLLHLSINFYFQMFDSQAQGHQVPPQTTDGNGLDVGTTFARTVPIHGCVPKCFAVGLCLVSLLRTVRSFNC